MQVSMTINGEQVSHDVEPRLLLVHYIRETVGLTTIHLTRAEELLRGQAPSEELFAKAREIAAEDCSPMADGRGPVDYKRHLAGVLTQRALRRAVARAMKQEA